MENLIKEKILFGGLYQINPEKIDLLKMTSNILENGNSQRYGSFLPVCTLKNDGSERFFMVDTYQINNPYGKDYFDLIKKICSWKDPEKGTQIKNKCFDYFYAGCFEVTGENIEAFNLVCDLRDYKPISTEEALIYDDSNIIRNVRLYQNHNYSWDYGARGITLLRIGATPDEKKELKRVFSDVLDLRISPFDYDYNNAVNELKKIQIKYPCVKDNYFKQVNACNKYLEIFKNLQDLYQNSLESYRDILSRFEEGQPQENFTLHVPSGDIIAKEETNANPGVGLYFMAEGEEFAKPLAIVECHDDPSQQVAGETEKDIVTYIYSDDANVPTPIVRKTRNTKDLLANAKVRGLTVWDDCEVDAFNKETKFDVPVEFEGYAYGIFENGTHLVGYCTLGSADIGMPKSVWSHPAYSKEESLILSDVYIDPKYRRNGLAQKLIKEAIRQKYKANGKKSSVFLTCFEDYQKELYEKLGFSLIEEDNTGCWMVYIPSRKGE